jgi:hypothetical protein
MSPFRVQVARQSPSRLALRNRHSSWLSWCSSMADKTQEELEAPAKVYQVDSLADKLDNIEKLIKDQRDNYVTKDKLDLRLQPLEDARSKSDRRTVWLGGAVGLMILTTLWQVIVNGIKGL